MSWTVRLHDPRPLRPREDPQVRPPRRCERGQQLQHMAIWVVKVDRRGRNKAKHRGNRGTLLEEVGTRCPAARAGSRGLAGPAARLRTRSVEERHVHADVPRDRAWFARDPRPREMRSGRAPWLCASARVASTSSRRNATSRRRTAPQNSSDRSRSVTSR